MEPLHKVRETKYMYDSSVPSIKAVIVMPESPTLKSFLQAKAQDRGDIRGDN